MKRLVRVVIGLGVTAVAFACACGSSSSSPDEIKFQSSDADILNPERGLYLAGKIDADWNFSKMRMNGMTLTYAHVDLPRTTPIPADLLATMDTNLGHIRDAGLKVIVRFAYNSGASMPDAPLDVVLEDITELTPLLRKNADVIIALEAGFIGDYGEWHDSQNGLDAPGPRKQIVEAELAALPASRAVLLRTPMYKMENWGGPLTDGFTGDSASRIGQHNDCFLATDTDYGTYAKPVDQWMNFVAQETQFVPMEGGPCKVNPPRSACENALAELAKLHYSLLSSRGNDDVWTMWKADGCADDIARNVGYRFRFNTAHLVSAIAPGGALALSLEIENVGYAGTLTQRPVYVVLDGNGQHFTAQLTDVDPRRWLTGKHTITTKLRIPGNLGAGMYRLSLWMPDADMTLASRPEYSIQFANDGVWDAATATNTITDKLSIDPAAPSDDVDGSATSFVVLP